jgi:hypothetical protein
MKKQEQLHERPHPTGYVATNNRKLTKDRLNRAEKVQSIPIYKNKVLAGYKYIYHT